MGFARYGCATTLRHSRSGSRLQSYFIEAKVAQEGIMPTESQLAALEKAKQEKEAHGEVETEHPVYLGAQ